MSALNASARREAILDALRSASGPVSASHLSARFGVSRQIIVGDVALLRAAGEAISATPRGYVLARESALLVRTVACCHKSADMEKELCIMVDNGCVVRDVIVEHPLYGQLTGALSLKSRFDVAQFCARAAAADAAPLSALTDGIHLHTLLCPDEASFRRVREALSDAGFLFPECQD
jgi:uncharacterized protein